MEERTIIRLKDLDGVQEGNIVVVGLENVLSSGPPVEIFWAKLSKESPSGVYPFGGYNSSKSTWERKKNN